MPLSISRFLSRSGNSKRNQTRRRLRQALRCESLEQRRLLAGDTWEVSYDPMSNSQVASDLTGNAVVANSTAGEMNIRKFDTSGQELWSNSFGGFNSGRVMALEITPAGQIIVAGRVDGSIDFDPGAGQRTLTTYGTDGFIASYRDDGTSISLNWAHLIGDSVNDFVIDAQSNVLAGGSFGTSLEFDSAEVLSSATNYDVGSFLTRLGTDGTLDWARQIEDAGVFQVRSIAIDSTQAIYVGGRNYTDDADAINPQYPEVKVEGQALANGGDRDGYVLRFNQSPSGAAFNDYYHFGEGPDGESVTDIEIDSADDLYVVGRNVGAGDIPFAGTTISTSTVATVVGKVSLDGGTLATQWVRAIQNEPSTQGLVAPNDLEIHTSPEGETTVYIAGPFTGAADFDPGSGEVVLESRNGSGFEGYLLSLDAQGSFRRVWQLGYETTDVSSVDDTGVHLAGRHIGQSSLVTEDVSADASFVIGLNTQQPIVVFAPPTEMVAGENLTIHADAYDLNNADISGSIVWTDTSGSILANGRVVSLSGLLADTYTITATATDSAGRTGSFTFDLQVNSDPIAIPDPGTLRVSKTVSAAEAVVIDDVNVSLDITHQRTDNLDVFLIAPDGTRVELFTDVGGRKGRNFAGTTLDSESANAIATASAPFSGTFRPEGDLSVFNGMNSEGTWSLEITDDRSRDTGELNGWFLDISGSPAVPNDPPVIDSTPVTVATQDAAYSYDVDATDPDAGSTLTYSLDDAPGGMLIDSASGVVTWTPNSGQVGLQSVTVRVADQQNAFDTQTFEIDVANVNDAPVAAGDSFAVEQGLVLEIGAAEVLANDTDADDDTLSVIQNTSPTNGTVVVNNDGSFTYTPNPGFVGTDNFTYEVSDGTLSTTGMVMLEVTAASTDEAIYVYDIRFESKRGNKDWRAVFEIRSDSNDNGLGDSADEPVAGVAITVTFGGTTYPGVTDSNGVFRTSWIRSLSGGGYDANVDSLLATGFAWDPIGDLNREDDSDGDFRPDARLLI